MNEAFGEGMPRLQPVIPLQRPVFRYGIVFACLPGRYLFIFKNDIMKKKAAEQASGEYRQRKKKPVDILDPDKGTTTRNPLHGDLSESPEKENKAVRDDEKNKKAKH